MKTRMFLLAALVAIVLTTGFSHMAFAKGGSGGGDKVRIALNGSANYPNADGKASYKVQGTKREFEAEVEHIKKLKGQTVNVFVNGTKVASAKVDTLGQAETELSTELGNSVPKIKSGDKVEIRTTAGVVIVSGSF